MFTAKSCLNFLHSFLYTTLVKFHIKFWYNLINFDDKFFRYSKILIERRKERYFISLLWSHCNKTKQSAKQARVFFSRSATLIQSAWRRYQDVKSFNLKRNSCLKIQRWWRERKYEQKYLRRIVRIQALFRGFVLFMYNFYKLHLFNLYCIRF